MVLVSLFRSANYTQVSVKLKRRHGGATLRETSLTLLVTVTRLLVNFAIHPSRAFRRTVLDPLPIKSGPVVLSTREKGFS